jgi:glycosyltransferase involved in cell wall biosynthesis
MKVVMPFWNLDIFNRYKPQLEAIADNVDELRLLYFKGYPSLDTEIIFQKMKTYPIPKLMYPILLSNIHKQVDQDYDLVYSLSGRWQQMAGAVLSEKHDKPHVIRLRGDDNATLMSYSDFKAVIYNGYFRPLIKESFINADLILPIASHLTGNLPIGCRVGPVIPNGVDLDKFRYVKPPGELVIGYIGRLSLEKGCFFINEVMKETPDTKYIVAGPMQYKTDFPSNVKYLGEVPFGEVEKVYQDCSLIMNASYSEGLTNNIPEAYASGRPLMIAESAFCEDVKLFGFKLDHRTCDWINIINNINIKALDQIGVEAVKYAENFSWDKYGKSMVDEFKRVLDGGKTFD